MKMNQLIKNDTDFDLNINNKKRESDEMVSNTLTVHVDEEEDQISSSQSSIVSTNSSDFNYNVAEK